MTGFSAPPSTSIDIGICTFRRPELRDTLSSLFALAVPADLRVRLIVADNDAQPSAAELIEAMGPFSPFEITYVHCPQANISIARNACLSESDGDYLAFIDDDEVAPANWLADLFATILMTGADAVLGPVQAGYRADAPKWMRLGDFHSTRPVWVAGRIRTGYTCNVLLDMRAPSVAGRRFDLALGQSGGEDTQFFTAVTDAGGRIEFAPTAVLQEPVPARRASLSWLMKRRFRSGQTHGRIVATGRKAGGRAIQAGLAAAKLLCCTVLTMAGAMSTVARNRQMLRVALHAGAMAGILGFREIRQYGRAETA